MRLITKTTLLYVLLMIVVFGVGGIMTYGLVQDVVRQETDYSLRSDTRLVLNGIKEGKPIDALVNRKISIEEIPVDLEENPRGFIVDTLMQHFNLQRIEEFRKLTSTHKFNGKHYKIVVANVFIENEDMQEGVIRTMTRLFIGLSLVLLLFSFLVSKLLFKPFEGTLKSIEQFNLTDNKKIELPTSTTAEFKMLNRFVTSMTQKAQKDYTILKEFSENASHEIQTPIAIIQGKLELLQESSVITEEEMKLIASSQNSLTKLSKLAQSLALITKIENLEYASVELLDFSEIVRSSYDNFFELAQLKNLKMTENIDDSINLKIESSLADILVSNLIKNAIQHNMDQGWINVQLDNDKLLISNSGSDPGVNTAELFDRFKKANQSSQSLGLGLSIVKKICDLYKFDLNYRYENNEHLLEVKF